VVKQEDHIFVCQTGAGAKYLIGTYFKAAASIHQGEENSQENRIEQFCRKKLEEPMTGKKALLPVLQLFIILAVAVSSLGFVNAASAQANCGDSETVVSGDTLRKIATRCGTTVDALMRANPQITDRNKIFPGQVILLPGALIKGTGGIDTYIVKRGDTLNRLATQFNTTLARLLELNKDITNANVVFEGHRLAVPSGGSIPDTGTGQVYTVVRGDTLRKIAARFDTTVDEILKINPQIKNANLIFPGDRINIPATPTTYTVVRGDTLGKIAARFGTTVARLLELNPSIKNANLIYPGQVLRIR
jgi:LysM repeat protein